MNTTRKAFLNAGSIIAIILAVAFSLMAVLFIGASSFVTEDNLNKIYQNDNAYEYVEDGAYYYLKGTDNNVEANRIYVKDLGDVAKIVRGVMKGMGWMVLLFEVAEIVCSIFVLRVAKKNSNRNGWVIALLVLSLCSFNLLTFAFMIVGLCLRNQTVEIETKQQA